MPQLPPCPSRNSQLPPLFFRYVLSGYLWSINLPTPPHLFWILLRSFKFSFMIPSFICLWRNLNLAWGGRFFQMKSTGGSNLGLRVLSDTIRIPQQRRISPILYLMVGASFPARNVTDYFQILFAFLSGWTRLVR